MTKSAKLEDRVVAHVRRVAAVRGHGILRHAQQQAGLSDAYLRNVSAGSVGLGRVRAILEGCGLDVAETVRNALDAGPVARFVANGLRLAPYVKDLPPPVRKTIYRMRAKWEEQDGGVDLDAIDAQRYEVVQGALKAIEDALGVVKGPKTYARALGIWGSAQRMCYRLDYATIGIGLAIEAAQASCDRALVGDMLIRAAYVLRDRGELDWALEVGDVLLELRASLRDHENMGRAFVVHGSLLRSAGAYAESIRCNRAAIGLLPADSVQWRFDAYHSLSFGQVSQEDPVSAEASALAASALEPLDPHRAGRLAWLRGRIALKRGKCESAIGFYRSALGQLSSAPVDAALLGAELVRVMLQAGRVSDAQVVAGSLAPLADRVSEHPLDLDQAVSSALLDLSFAGLQARASLKLVSRVMEAVERGRAGARARLRRDLRL